MRNECEECGKAMPPALILDLAAAHCPIICGTCFLVEVWHDFLGWLGIHKRNG